MEMADEGKQLVHSRPVHSLPPLVPQPYPWLVICHGKNEQRQTFFSISEDRYYRRIIPEMRNKYIWYCSHGWLVLEDLDSDDCCLLHPVSMVKIQLPPLVSIDYCNCVLSLPPSDPDCRVLFIDSSGHYLLCQPGDHEFVEQGFEVEDELLVTVTTFEGKIYGLTLPGYTLVIADFIGRSLRFRQLIREGLPRPSPPETIRTEDFLIESCGELLFVHKIYIGLFFREVLGFRVFRADFSEMVWVELKSIGEGTIFLARGWGMSCSAVESGIKGNSIYFTEPHDRCLYVFNLEDQSISVSLPCPIVSRRHSSLKWVMMPDAKIF